jgi:hypothetical protein
MPFESEPKYARAYTMTEPAGSNRVAKPTVDWESVERQYRAGMLSIREIAKAYGVNHATILKRAKRDSWSRDLTAKVKAAVTTGLVTTEVTTSDAKTERKIIEQAAVTIITLVRGHRKDIGNARAVAEKLLKQLEDAATNRPLLEKIVSEVEDGDTGASTIRRNALMRAVSLPSHAGILRDLSTVYKSLILLERQAFNMDAGEPEKSDEPVKSEVPLTDIEELRKVFAARKVQR